MRSVSQESGLLRAKQSACFNELVSGSHSILGALQLADSLFEVRSLAGFPRLTMWMGAWLAHSRSSLCQLLTPCLEIRLPTRWDKSLLSSGCSLGAGIWDLESSKAGCQVTRQVRASRVGSHPSLAHSPESRWRIQNPLLPWGCHRRGTLKETRRWPLLSPLWMAPTAPFDLTFPLLVLLKVGGRALMPCKRLPWCFYSIHLQSSLWRPAQSGDKWLFRKCGVEGR